MEKFMIRGFLCGWYLFASCIENSSINDMWEMSEVMLKKDYIFIINVYNVIYRLIVKRGEYVRNIKQKGENSKSHDNIYVHNVSVYVFNHKGNNVSCSKPI